MLSTYKSIFSCRAYRFAQLSLRLVSARAFSASHYHVPSLIVATNSKQRNVLQNLSQHQCRVQQCQWRGYAQVTAADLTHVKISERVMTVIKLFEKINADKLTMESHFMKDLGLDSLDHVELIMAVEDEFGFEIPDQDAEKLVRPSDVIKFLCLKLEVAAQ